MSPRSAARRLPRPIFAALLSLTLFWAPPAKADFAAGVAAYDRGEYAAAYEAWLPLARAGDPAAQRNIGHLCRFGLGVAQDFERAAYWYREAAEAGLAAAQTNLAVMYLRGQGVTADAERAAYWFRLAAVQGHAVAQYNLGLLYLSGNGVGRSEARAMGWFHLAAKAGHGQALEALSKLVLASATLVGPSLPPGWKPSDGEAAAVEPPAQGNATSSAEVKAPATSPANTTTATGPDDVPAIDVIEVLSKLFADGNGETKPVAPAAAMMADSEAEPDAAETAGGGTGEFAGVDYQRPVSARYVDRPGDQQRLTEAMVAFHAGDYEVARGRLLPLAQAGMAEAQYRLGVLNGRPDFEGGDRAEAFVWLTLAAERGHPEAAEARAALMERMSSEERLRSHALLQARRGRS